MISITLPLPPKCLFKNSAPPASRGAKIGRSEAIKKVRSEAAIMTKASTAAVFVDKLAIRSVFYFADHRARHDRHNLIHPLQPVLDGIQDALGVNDRDFIVATPEIEYGCRKLVVHIAPVESKAAPAPPAALPTCRVCGNPMIQAVQPNWVICEPCHLRRGVSADEWRAAPKKLELRKDGET